MKDKQRSTLPMKDKHTPGPWLIAEDQVGDDDGNTIATICQLNIWNTTEGMVTEEMPWEANAELIRAAPEMLEFIQKVAHWELVDYDQHEYVMEDEEVREGAHRILNAYGERLKRINQ